MRYFELIEDKSKHSFAPAVDADKRNKTQLIRIPAGSVPVQVYIRDGKLFVISDQPLQKVTKP